MDIRIYALNASRFLSGEEPTEVNATISTNARDPRFKEVEEHVTFQLRFPSAILANCTSSYGYFHQSHFSFVGPKVGWRWTPPAGTAACVRGKKGCVIFGKNRVDKPLQFALSSYAATQFGT